MNWLPLVAMAIWFAATFVTLILFIGWVRRAEQATARLKLAEGGVMFLRSPPRRIRDLKRGVDNAAPETGGPGGAGASGGPGGPAPQPAS